MITKQQYVEYLLSTPINHTCTNLAEHLEGINHDVVSDYLEREKLSARHLWELVETLIDDSPEAWLIVDDSVHSKQYSQSIKMVKLQYSGAVGGLVRGIGVVSIWFTRMEKMANTIRLIFGSTPKKPMARPKTIISKKCC